MKKIFALVLAAIMILSAVGAMAAGSKSSSTISYVVPPEEPIKVVKTEDNDGTSAIKQAIIDAQANGSAIDGLPAPVKEKLGEGYVNINEMETYKIEGDIDGVSDDVKLVFKFATPYPEGETVILAIGIVPPEGEAEWLVKEGVANADGDVEVTVTKEELQKISDNPFVVIPVSK
jgi:hypothetical protein